MSVMRLFVRCSNAGDHPIGLVAFTLYSDKPGGYLETIWVPGVGGGYSWQQKRNHVEIEKRLWIA